MFDRNKLVDWASPDQRALTQPRTLTWQESLKTQSSSASVTELEVDQHVVIDLSELDPRICIICQVGSTKPHQPKLIIRYEIYQRM